MAITTVSINKVQVPVRDILSVKAVKVTDTDFMEVQYRLFSPSYHTLNVLVDCEEGIQIQKAINENK